MLNAERLVLNAYNNEHRTKNKEQYFLMIETERLILRPLTYQQLKKYAKGDNSLETEFNLHATPRPISEELKEALETTILPNVADESKNYLFSTIWTAISKTENKMVGDICMYGEPNENGEIEIGYGTHDEFQRKGYMTEIVKGIINWAKTQKQVKSILASTEKSNAASFKVLEKNNFIKIGETETLFNWRLEITNLNSEVTAFLDGLNHPFRNEIEQLRICILSANTSLAENIKWNGPNYSIGSEDRITMRVHPPVKQVQLIFHRGAKKQELPKEKLIANKSKLLLWKETDRAIATFKSLQDIENGKTELAVIINEWIAAVR